MQSSNSSKSKEFSLSMENIPQPRVFFCFSIKFGAIVAALVTILYSLLALAECGYGFTILPELKTSNDFDGLLLFTILLVIATTHGVTFALSAVLLVGILKEKAKWVKPWLVWVSILTMTYTLLFLFSSTMNIVNHYSEGPLIYVLLDFLILVMRIYLLLTVTSHYKQMIDVKGDDYAFMKIQDKDAWRSTV